MLFLCVSGQGSSVQPSKESWPFVQWRVRFIAGSFEVGCLSGLSWPLLFEGQPWMGMAPGSPRRLNRAQCPMMESVSWICSL